MDNTNHLSFCVLNARRYARGLLGLPVNPDRPNDKLPYDGAWLMMGPEMVHLMELPNPDPSHLQFRPEHGEESGGWPHAIFTFVVFCFFFFFSTLSYGWE